MTDRTKLSKQALAVVGAVLSRTALGITAALATRTQAALNATAANAGDRETRTRQAPTTLVVLNLRAHIHYAIRQEAYNLKANGGKENRLISKELRNPTKVDLTDFVEQVKALLAASGVYIVADGRSHKGRLPPVSSDNLFNVESTMLFNVAPFFAWGDISSDQSQFSTAATQGWIDNNLNVNANVHCIAHFLAGETEALGSAIEAVEKFVREFESFTAEPVDDAKLASDTMGSMLAEGEKLLTRSVCGVTVLNYLVSENREFMADHIRVFQAIYPALKVEVRVKLPKEVRKALTAERPVVSEGEEAAAEPTSA